MIDKHISKTELTHLAGISTNAMAKLGRDVIIPEGIVEFVPDSESKKSSLR